jgi:hypothetical protein
MSGKQSLRIRFTLPRSSSASVSSSGLTTPSVPLGMQTRGSVMASKETRKRGATGAGEETGTKKKPRTKAAEQAAFAEEFEGDFEAMPVEPKKTKTKGTKEGGKGTKRKAGETKVLTLDESLEIFPASQKIPIDRPSKKTKIHTRVEATGVMQDMAYNIRRSTLEDTLNTLSAIPVEAGPGESQAVVLPLGYLLEPPVKVAVNGKQVEVQPNSRLPSREGIERIKSQFRANGYSKEAAVMIGVLSISESLLMQSLVCMMHVLRVFC